MTRVRIENATYLVTVDENDQVLHDATITIDDGTITSITTADGETDSAATERERSLRPLAGSGGSTATGPEPPATPLVTPSMTPRS